MCDYVWEEGKASEGVRCETVWEEEGGVSKCSWDTQHSLFVEDMKYK